MAPEVINSDPEVGYGRAADIWSFGCVIIQMFTGEVGGGVMQELLNISLLDNMKILLQLFVDVAVNS